MMFAILLSDKNTNIMQQNEIWKDHNGQTTKWCIVTNK